MKVIDLLNKIANGEEVPEKIKFSNKYWFYNPSVQDYRDDELTDDGYYLFETYFENEKINDFLNSYIYIINYNKVLATNDDGWLAEPTIDYNLKFVDEDEIILLNTESYVNPLIVNSIINGNNKIFINKLNQIIEQLHKK